MNILVQKYGGTSVATSESRKEIYKKIEHEKANGKSLVVVISAMGRKGEPYATDTLIGLVRDENIDVADHEYAQIYACGEIIAGCVVTAALQRRGHKAIYLTGQQAGIITDSNYADASIVNISTDRIMKLLNEGYIVVVAGGQGATENGDITSLGRGGSDTTGCALGVALGASQIEIFTDVDGVMTGDPKKIKDARLLKSISHEDCINMANNGAKVMHPRSVEAAAKDKKIKLYVKSTFSDYVGTLIGDDEHTPTGESYLIGIASLETEEAVIINLLGKGLDKDKTLLEKIDRVLSDKKITAISKESSPAAIRVSVAKNDFEVAVNLLHSLI